MGLFVTIEIDKERCEDGCNLCVETCPMKIFKFEDDEVKTDYDKEDECTFCNVCIERCKYEAIEIRKNY